MKICIDEHTYEGSAAEIMEQLRQQTFDPTEYPDTGKAETIFATGTLAESIRRWWPSCTAN